MQVVALPVGAGQAEAASAFARAAVHRGLRAEVVEEGSLGARIRGARRVPYLAVIGAREDEAGAVSIRRRDGDGVPMPGLADALSLVEQECSQDPG